MKPHFLEPKAAITFFGGRLRSPGLVFTNILILRIEIRKLLRIRASKLDRDRLSLYFYQYLHV